MPSATLRKEWARKAAQEPVVEPEAEVEVDFIEDEEDDVVRDTTESD